MTFKGRSHRRNRAPKWRFSGKGGANVKVWFWCVIFETFPDDVALAQY